jgi:hypothetical protein
MLEFLERLVAVLDLLPPEVPAAVPMSSVTVQRETALLPPLHFPQKNCNMAATNYVVHKFFLHRIATGFPLTRRVPLACSTPPHLPRAGGLNVRPLVVYFLHCSRFLMRQGAPRGVYIVHK